MVEVMLMADVKKLGKAGAIVKVAPGYARNMLLPQGLAAPVTEASKRRLAKLAKPSRMPLAMRDAAHHIRAKRGLPVQCGRLADDASARCQRSRDRRASQVQADNRPAAWNHRDNASRQATFTTNRMREKRGGYIHHSFL